MKKLILLLLTVVIFFSSCNNNDDDEEVIIKEYILQEANNSGISGSIFFIGSSVYDDIFSIKVHLTGAELEESYTANIHNNSLSNGGDVTYLLGDFYDIENSDLMISSTNFDSLDRLVIENEILDYPGLTTFDGHIKIFNNDDPSIVVAEGNIGNNL
jgi:hypothetical protein